MPLFALLLPVIFVMAGLAINVSHVRLLKTEMKIATDSAAHAAGRAMSIHQTTAAAVNYAKSVAAMNSVGGCQLDIVDDNQVGFGMSTRQANGYGRYSFSPVSRQQVDNGTKQANSVALTGIKTVPLLFRGIPNTTTVEVASSSVSTQVDRDIALVLDRSGSMVWYKSQEEWNYVFDTLRSWRLISNSERNTAKNNWDDTHTKDPSQYMNQRVRNALYNNRNYDDAFRDVYDFNADLAATRSKAPRHSRWAQLAAGVHAFLDVLETTDQEELLSVATFSTNSSLNYALSLSYSPVRGYVDNLMPNGSTAIGKGINTAIPSIMTSANARPFAAKTIVILTDGVNNVNPAPKSAAQAMVNNYNITLHTVTFTDGADQEAMEEVAGIGGGKHYHADNGQELIDIFEEIANNLPTILTF